MEAPHFPPPRWPLGLLAAAMVATTGTSLLVVIVPLLVRHSFSALPLGLWVAATASVFVLPGAIVMGTVGALICLTAPIFIAAHFRARMPGYMYAGVVAGFGHTAISVLIRWLERPSPFASGFWWFGMELMPMRPHLQDIAGIGLAAAAGGMAAGAVFSLIVLPPGERSVPAWARPVFALPASALALLAAMLVFHDREGDSDLCAHTDQVRVSVGTTHYVLPAVAEPRISPLAGNKPPHIFRRFEHVGTHAAGQTQNSYVYCQTALDNAWRIDGFEISSFQGRPQIADDVTYVAVNRQKPRPRTYESVAIHASNGSPDLGWIPDSGAVMVWPEHGPMSRTELTGYGFLAVQLDDGSWLSARIRFDENDPQAALPSLRAVGRFLASHSRPIRP